MISMRGESLDWYMPEYIKFFDTKEYEVESCNL